MKENQNVQKTDEGFELIYSKLSYRRKFFRTLWMSPTIILAVIFVWKAWHSNLVSIIVALVLITIEIAQAVYTYKKWKSEERNCFEK